MKSKTSLFSPGLSRSILSRFWPLWLLYFGFLSLSLPITLSSYLTPGADQPYIVGRILNQAVNVAVYAMIASLLSVMAVFSYLYSKRSCSLINSMPLRRETAFITACLTGLMPLLLAEVLTWLISLSVFAGSQTVLPEYLNSWLLAALLSTLASYGFGVFCAMLTGHILVLPALFLVLNVAALVLEVLVKELLRILVYGYDGGMLSLTWLSPLMYLSDNFIVIAEPGTAGGQGQVYSLHGMDALGAYAAAGVVLMALSLLLYRRRKMECTGDVVAVKLLEPVFKYCASVYAALAIGVFLTSGLDNVIGSEDVKALVMALLLVIGAALGYYAAEMLLQKSLRVFRSRMTALFVIWAVLLLGVATAVFDLTGYERRVPKTEEIQSVALVNDGTVTEDAESIELVRKIHQTAIANEEHNRQTDSPGTIYLRYDLKDGSSLGRCYWVDGSQEWIESDSSEFALCRELYMLPQNKELLMETDIPVEAKNIVSCYIEQVLLMGDELYNYYEYEQLRLSPQQAEELYTQCILPDSRDSMLGTQWFYMDEEAYETRSDVSLNIYLKKPLEDKDSSYWVNVNITLDAERSIAWLEDNLGIEVKPYLEVRPDVLADRDYY